MALRTFPGNFESLAEIAEFIRLEGKKAGLSNKEIFELETAVDEAVSNIIEHAYGGEGLGEINLICKPIADGIEVILEDFGQPFDPSCVAAPDLSIQLENRKNHGLGYYLMCQLTDVVHFEFSDSQNRLTLIKRKK